MTTAAGKMQAGMAQVADAPLPAGPSAWQDALLVADLLALDSHAMGGAVVHGAAGPVRDAWLARVRTSLPDQAPMLRVPCHCPADRLLGGLDLAATLGTGQRVQETGLLARADGGVAVLAMAERWTTGAAALVTAVLDRAEIALERDGFEVRTPTHFGIIALDESCGEEEGPPAILGDRLAFRIDLDGVGLEEFATGVATIPPDFATRARHRHMPAPATDIIKALCHAAFELGIGSLRAAALAVAVARAHAALAGRDQVIAADAAVAARLVLAPRATRMPADAAAPKDQQKDQDQQDQAPPPGAADNDQANAQDDTADTLPPDDLVLAAARAAIPADLLATLVANQQRAPKSSSDGRAGALRKSVRRGRVTGVQEASSVSGARLNVLATLQAAAPWQRLRRNGRNDASTFRIQVRRDDFRISRFKNTSGTTIIFAVDASGSAALNRLTEAKGAVELLLAECYARRDNVALVAFRGTTAEVRLPPSRSLARAKRSLAGLPGGGGTPLAAGLDAALEISAGARRKGDTPLVVVLTDARANVTREGKGGRPEAERQALGAARQMQSQNIKSVLLDTSPQPNPFARRLAAEMGGRYVPLPVAGAEAISTAVQRERT
jgi:magnesium chelatase subunit D